MQTLYKSANQGVTWQPLLTFQGGNPTITSVFVNHLNYIFVSPNSTASASSLGLWRSIDGGQTWQRVLALSTDCSILSVAEDSNGNLFAGVYTSGNTGNASIYRSRDGGAHWNQVYYNSNARHVHAIEVDPSNNYIYATLGDARINSQWNALVIRATDGGIGNSSWSKIFTLPQMLAVEAVDGRGPNGQLYPIARLFATDYDNGQVYRTTDDKNFNLVLDTGTQSYGWWIRTNDLNGYIYASFSGGEHPQIWLAGIWISTNYGATWSIYETFPIHNAYYGSLMASNFVQGTMYYSVQLDGGWQNGVKIYPDYGGVTQNSFIPQIALPIVVSREIVLEIWAITLAASFSFNFKKTITILCFIFRERLAAKKAINHTVFYKLNKAIAF